MLPMQQNVNAACNENVILHLLKKKNRELFLIENSVLPSMLDSMNCRPVIELCSVTWYDWK